MHVEGYDAGSPVDLSKLDGTWRLNYTTASDVLVLFEAAARLPFLQVPILLPFAFVFFFMDCWITYGFWSMGNLCRWDKFFRSLNVRIGLKEEL